MTLQFYLAINRRGFKPFIAVVNPGDLFKVKNTEQEKKVFLIPQQGYRKHEYLRLAHTIDWGQIQRCYVVESLGDGVSKYIKPKRPKTWQ